jgi:hypothetical protein
MECIRSRMLSYKYPLTLMDGILDMELKNFLLTKIRLPADLWRYFLQMFQTYGHYFLQIEICLFLSWAVTQADKL